jgi:hypothetical protein
VQSLDSPKQEPELETQNAGAKLAIFLLKLIIALVMKKLTTLLLITAVLSGSAVQTCLAQRDKDSLPPGLRKKDKLPPGWAKKQGKNKGQDSEEAEPAVVAPAQPAVAVPAQPAPVEAKPAVVASPKAATEAPKAVEAKPTEVTAPVAKTEPAKAITKVSPKAELAQRMQAVNTATQRRARPAAVTKFISQECGVSEATLEAQRKKYPKVQPAGLLLANEMAQVSKKPAGRFLEAHTEGKEWDELAKANDVPLDRLNRKLAAFERALAQRQAVPTRR